MNIYARNGHKVVYLAENGYDCNRVGIEKLGVKKGDVLTVSYTDVCSFGTSVCFHEIDGAHNSVMFEDCE